MSTTSLMLTNSWDLSVKGENIAVCDTDQYAMAQDVATACRLFYGENWYNVKIGVKYFEDILGKMPPKSLISAYYQKAALSVPGVVAVKVFVDSILNRRMRGRILFTDAAGLSHNVSLTSPLTAGTPATTTGLEMLDTVFIPDDLEMLETL
jgi:hypothetical protein